MSRFRRFAALAAILGGVLAAGCAKEIQVGAIVSETGVADVYGKKVKQGLDLALDEINAAGGILGKPVILAYRDDQSDPKVGAVVAEDLIEEVGVSVIIGAVTSPVTIEIAPLCERNRVVLLSPTASAPSITDAGVYIFRNYPSDILEGTTIADFARDLGLARVVIFAVNNEFGRGLKEIFKHKYENRFRQVVKVFDFSDSSRDQFPAMVKEAVALKPDGIYLIGYVNEVAALLKMIREGGSKAVLMSSASVTEDVIRLAGSASEHLVYPQPPFDPDSREPEVQAFVEAYRARYSETPDTFAAHGYDALKLVALGIQNGGSALADDIRAGLAGITDYKGASGAAGFDNNGDVVEYPRLFIIHQGTAMPYERFLEQGGSLDTSRGG